MSSYTDNLKIELITNGTQLNVWGDTTNNNFQYGLEQAIVGRGEVAFATDEPTTITLQNTNSSQDARNLFLYVTSDVSLGATRNLIVPTIEKTYIVENQTSGGQAILVKTAAGTGVTIPNNKRVLLYVDGVNVIEQLNYLANADIGTITFTNPVPIASGGTNAITASAARTSLGVAIGTDVQAYNIGLQDISGLAKTDSNFIVADGTNWVAETGATARTSLGLGSMAIQNSGSIAVTGGTINSVAITGGSVTGITDLTVADGGTGSSSLTLNSVLIGNGTSALLAVAPGTDGNVLTAASGAWASSSNTRVTTISGGTTGLTPASATSGAVTLAGTLAVANGGTGVTTSTGTTNNVLSASPTFTGTPLSTTAASGTNTTQIATTAFAYGTLSASTSGYTKLANGMICQWGQVNGVASSSATLTYPISFPTACYSLVITCVFAGNVNGSSDATVCFSPVGQASTTIHSTITGNHCWMAWGI